MRQGIIDCGGFETAMEHAVGTLRIAPAAIASPVCLFHQSLKTLGIALIDQQITRLLPAEDITCGVPPWCALVSLVAGQKIKKQARLIESPFSIFAKLEDFPKEVFASCPHQEHVFLWCVCITITRGYRDAFDS